jgi:hypothetical protein
VSNVFGRIGREAAGVWRSMRYDLDAHRAARLGSAFTREIEPPDGGSRSRLVPLTGVALLVAGGAAGAVLAVSGGLAALGTDTAPLANQGAPATTTTQVADQPQVDASQTTRPEAARRPVARPEPASRNSVLTAPTESEQPLPEATDAPPSPSVSPTPEPSASAEPSTDPSATTDGPRWRQHRNGR